VVDNEGMSLMSTFQLLAGAKPHDLGLGRVHPHLLICSLTSWMQTTKLGSGSVLLRKGKREPGSREMSLVWT